MVYIKFVDDKKDKNDSKQTRSDQPVTFGKRKRKMLRQLAPVRIPTGA